MNQIENIYRGAEGLDHNIVQQVLVGWLKAQPTSVAEFHDFSKKFSEYQSCEMHLVGFVDQAYGNTILELLTTAEAQGKQFCLVHEIGNLHGQLLNEFEGFMNHHYSNQAIVGINEYQRLGGVMLINIGWWVSAGRPDPATDEFLVSAFQHGVRNWPDEASKEYSFMEIKITNLHPTTPNGYKRVLERVRKTLFNTDVFFCANTEDFNLSMQVSDIPTDTIISIAGGLSAVLMAYSNQMPPGSDIHIIDCSPLAIKMSKEIFENWDGTNYAGFIQQLMEKDPTINEKLRGVRKLSEINQSIDKLPNFVEWFNSTFKTYKIHYTELDLMEYQPVKELLMSVCGIDPELNPEKHMRRGLKTRRVEINFSNVYHYAPSAFYFGYTERKSMAEKTQRLAYRLSDMTATEIQLNGGSIGEYTELLEMFPWR
jgi:hypothetical protein